MSNQTQLVIVDCTGTWAKNSLALELVKSASSYLTHEFEHFTVHQFTRDCSEWDTPNLQFQVWASTLDNAEAVEALPDAKKVAVHQAVKRFGAAAGVDVQKMFHDGMSTYVTFDTREGFTAVPDLSWALFTVPEGSGWAGPVEEIKVEENT